MNPEWLGMFVLALGIMIGLITQIVNLFSKLISKPVKDLANAINSLEKLFERFVIIQDNQEDQLGSLENDVEKIKERLSKVEMNCAIKNAYGNVHKTP